MSGHAKNKKGNNICNGDDLNDREAEENQINFHKKLNEIKHSRMTKFFYKLESLNEKIKLFDVI